MEVQGKATSIDLFSLKTRPMRAFHMSWFSFFLCFFAWFGIAPLMAIVRDELNLTKTQIGNTIIASVAITIVARLFIGWLCDRIGPRLSYTFLLLFGSIPVMGIGFADSYYSFLMFRLGIGVIGASFVITQYHTSVMFAPNCVGTANATSAGWGNLGGGVTQIVMPLIFAAFVVMGYSDFWSWRFSMMVAGVVCFFTGIAYYFFTTDLPNGNFKELRAKGEIPSLQKTKGTFALAAKDKRVWALFVVYASCFGVELTINNIAALYFRDYFELGLKTAGLVAGLFGLMNIFARTMGGIIGDRVGHRWGLKGRVRWLFIALFVESLALMLFSRMTILPIAIGTMIIFSLFTQMSEGATYSVVPFINKKALGSVSGIVGAGGNMGAVAAGFIFRSENMSWSQGLFILGGLVMVGSLFTFFVTFEAADEKIAKAEHDAALAARAASAVGQKPALELPGLPAFIGRVRPMDLLRIYLGIALAIKGVYYVMNMQSLETQLGGGFGAAQNLIAWLVVAVNIVGGLALALGFATRVAAFANLLIVGGAIFVVHSAASLFGPTQDLQFALFVVFALALLLWRGSSTFSLDAVLRHNDVPSEAA